MVYQKPEEQFFLPTVLKEVSFGITDFKENQRQKEIKQQEKDWKKERDNKDTPNIPIDYQIQVYNNDL